MKKKSLLIILIILMTIPAEAQIDLIKREFRGAWIALVRNEDWPSEPGLSTDDQRQELRLILDELQTNNINAVFFQIRPECDAIYQSNYEPWSYWLTGEQGNAPEPFYDPLQFALDEAHKRGMEIHAWFNPYRVKKESDNYAVAPDYILNTHPEWIIDIGGFNFLDPGLPEVRDYTINVILDVVENYEIDGVHLDDYFYPYPPNQITNQDTATFHQYPRGFTDIEDWRRDNVNLLVQMIGDSVHSRKAYLKYGISPFGIWKNGVPDGIVGLDAYNVIYCDAVYWIQNQLLDYLIPQLYWPFGGQQDYGALLPWWSGQINGRHLYSGMGLYKAYPPEEYGAQIDLNRSDPNCSGGVFFKATNFQTNHAVSDYLQNNQFKFKALIPSMDWKDQSEPSPPVNLSFGQLPDGRGDGLIWDAPVGDDPFMYAVYRFSSLNPDPTEIDDPSNIVAISGVNFAALPPLPAGKNVYYFGVSSLSRNYSESLISAAIEVSIDVPEKTVLLSPSDNAGEQPENVLLRWGNMPHSSFSRVQIAADENFSNILFEKEGIKDTFLVVSGFTGQTEYYWRANSSNFAGEGEFSDVWSFTTGFPIPPVLLDPPHATTDLPLRPTFKWRQAVAAADYNLQIYLGTSISESAIKVDTLLSDTVCTITTDLTPDRVHVWRVSSSNYLGFGGWSETFGFKTGTETGVGPDNEIPTKYSLFQNYPNPFNPETTIKFEIPVEQMVSLVVYDVLGRSVATLVNNNLKAGTYSVSFSPMNLSSGIYLYRIRTEEFSSTKKLLYLK